MTNLNLAIITDEGVDRILAKQSEEFTYIFSAN